MPAVGSNKKLASRMRASEQIVFLTGEAKYTANNQIVDQLSRTKFSKVHLMLDCLPFLSLSVVGRRNVCRRFNISDETLEECLLLYRRPGEPEDEQARRGEDLQRVITATPELLDTKRGPRTQTGNKFAKSKKAKEGQASW